MFIRKSDLRPFLDFLAGFNEVYVPSGIRFEKLEEGTRITLDQKTRFSAKKLFWPASEEILSFRRGKTRYDIKAPRVILFGARPCDLNAIEYMDRSLKDNQYYIKKRKNSTLIGLQCKNTKLFDNCYCHYTCTFFANNYDLLLIEKGGGFLVDARTDKGKRLLRTRFFSDSGDAASRLKAMKKSFSSRKRKDISCISPEAIRQMAKDCYSCTACTQVCPTCQSFIMEDRLNPDLESGSRLRLWDSCQLKRYTRVAGEVVFRPEREQRVRQRIMCKFRYSLEDNGMMSCTGCGRCIDVCTKDINIFKVFEE